jgi:hypothetical protein
MATNPVGRGTVTVGVNFLKSERAILGRLALAEDRSLGDFVRRQVISGLRSTYPAAAAEMESARKKHNEQMLLIL